MSINVESIQIALFFPLDTVFKSIKVAGEISNKFGHIFQEEPNIISLPVNAPIEIPKVIFNQQNIANLSVGYSRADLIITDKGIHDDIDNISNIYQEMFVDTLKIRVIRVGFIKKYVLDDVNINDFIESHLKSQKIQKVEELHMSWLNKIEVDKIEINKWTRLHFSEQNRNGYLLFDLNTDLSQIIDLKANPLNKLIKEFLNETSGDVEDVI